MDQEQNNLPMPAACDQSRRMVLDLSLSARACADLAMALAHIEDCEKCQDAVNEFDQIGQMLAPTSNEADSTNWVDRAVAKLPPPHRPVMRWAAFWQMAMAASFALTLAMGGYWLGHQNQTTTATSSPPSVDNPIAQAELSNRAQAFEQVNRAFDNRAGWLLVSDSGSDVGLDAEPSTETGMLLIRLTVKRRNNPADATANGSIVSSADLAILPGRTARLSLPFPQGRVLSYEISVGTGEPTRLDLLAELLPAGGSGRSTGTIARKPLAALSATVDMHPGGASPAGSFVTGTAGYEVSIGFAKAKLP